jgi:hypothetical protein
MDAEVELALLAREPEAYGQARDPVLEGPALLRRDADLGLEVGESCRSRTSAPTRPRSYLARVAASWQSRAYGVVRGLAGGIESSPRAIRFDFLTPQVSDWGLAARLSAPGVGWMQFGREACDQSELAVFSRFARFDNRPGRRSGSTGAVPSRDDDSLRHANAREWTVEIGELPGLVPGKGRGLGRRGGPRMDTDSPVTRDERCSASRR